MSAGLSEAGAQAASLALKMGSAAVDTIVFMAELGEELPVVMPVLKTLTAVREKMEMVKTNRDELAALHERCTYIMACFIVKCRQNPSSEIDVAPIERCIEAALEFVDRSSRRGKVSRVLKASSDKDEIALLSSRVDRQTVDLGLVGIGVLEGKANDMKAMLQAVLSNQKSVWDYLRKMPVKQANVPKGTPARKSWHVERRNVMDTVLKALIGGTGPRLVGLVGHSGSGKTTVASEIVRSTEVREAFSDGIVWLTVNNDAKGRLSSLMLQLARKVFEDVVGSVGCAPREPDDGAAYVKQRVARGQGGNRLKCLVVADNVWEKEVVSQLLGTGMWVLLSTRDEGVVSDAEGEIVGVDELSLTDAESVLRRAAELAPEVRLPDDAVGLIGLCGRVAMDLAFVGRWSIVRGREDQTAWSDAAGKVRAEMNKLGGGHHRDGDGAIAGNARAKQRRAILQAGLEDLATGVDDERVQRLYFSLAVMPDGHSFSVTDAAVLLYNREPTTEDENSVKGVLDTLERWSVLRSVDSIPVPGAIPYFERFPKQRSYFLHDSHSHFARESLMDRGDVRRTVLARWVRHICSLEALRSTDGFIMKDRWLAVEGVGGDCWQETRPYAAELAGMSDSDPLLWQSMVAVARFQGIQEDWEGANTTCRRMIQFEETKLGLEDVSVLRNLGRMFKRAGRGEEADMLLRRGLDIHERKLGPEDVELSSTLSKLGDGLREEGRLEETAGLLRRCLGIDETVAGQRDPEVIKTLQTCIQQTGRLEETEGLLRRCLGVVEAKMGSEDAKMAHTLHALGSSARQSGRLGEAEGLLRRCLAIEEAKRGPQHLFVAFALQDLGVCIREAGRFEEAEELLRRSLGITEATLGREHAQAAFKLHDLGVCLRKAGRLGDAEGLLRRCLGIKEAKLGPGHMWAADTLHQLGVCVWQAGRLDEAEEVLRQCLVLTEATLGSDQEGALRTIFQLGVCVREAGRLDESEEWFRRCKGIIEAKIGPKDAKARRPQSGTPPRQIGQLEEAERLLRRFSVIGEHKLGCQNSDVNHILGELAVYLREAHTSKGASYLC